MALKLIGAVGVKVRPEAENFRDEAERQIRRQYGDGRDGEHVDVRVRPKLDEQRMRRDFDRHRETMRRTMQTMMDSIEVQAPRLDNSRFTRDAEKLRADNKKLYAALSAERQKFQREEAKGWGTLLREHAKYEETVASSTSGFKGRQKILAQMAEMARATAEIGRATAAAADAQERWDRAAGLNIARYVLNLNKARQELGRVRDQQENIDKANFRGTNNALMRMRGELQKTATIFDDVARQVREFGQSGATKKMRVDVDTLKAWKDTQRFRHLWNQIPDQERRTLAVRIQMEDNEAIEKFQEFKRELDSLSNSDLYRRLRGFAAGTREHAAAQELLNERLREARRLNSGWAQQNSEAANQARDNARLVKELEHQERLRAMTAAELGRVMRSTAKDTGEYSRALDEMTDRLREARRVSSGWQTLNSAAANQARDNARLAREVAEQERLRAMSAAELGRSLRSASKDTGEYSRALDELNDRLREARRVSAGWQTLNSAAANQARDNARLAREVAEQEKIRARTAAELGRIMRTAGKDTEEYARALAEVNERLREARRVSAGWQEINRAEANQARDNARLTREVAEQERMRQRTAAELGRIMRSTAKDTEEYSRALAEVNDRLETLRRRRDQGWDWLNTEGGQRRLQQNDNDRVMREFRENQRRMREEAEKTRDYIDGMEADLKVDLDGTEAAAAHLKWLTRPRTIPLHVKVSGKSVAIAEGLLQSITGMNALRKLGVGFENVLRHYDKFTILTSLVTAAVGNLVNVIVGGVASIFSVGQGLAHVLQGVAMAPTLLGAIATSAVVAATALGDFFSALASGDYSELSGNALKNAEMLKGSWTELSEVIKDNFWAEAGTSMGRFVNKALPALTRGLGDTAAEMGKLWDNVWTSFERSLDVGYFDRMFDGLSGMMRELAGAAGPFMDAIMQLGARGAEHLPRLGEWLREGAEGFERFIAEADEAGRIDQWIENAAAGIQNLGVVARGAGKMMEGLARAALDAGGPSLEQFANAMDRWGDAVQSMRGQEILGLMFEGAYEGLARLGDGMGNFFATLGDHMGWLRDIMAQSGGIGGALFDSLATIFDNATFRDGTLQGLRDIEEAARDLEPAFDSAAEIIGTMARVSGAVLKGIAPTINEVVGLVSGMVSDLADPIIDLIPRLTSSVGALVGMIEPGVRGVTGAIGGMIDGFNKLPGPIQTALLTLGGLMAMRPHLRSMVDAVTNRVLPAYTRWGSAARAVQAEHQAAGRNISMMTAGYRHLKTEMAASTRLARMQGLEIGRVGAAFAALDRITGSSLYGVYDGAVRARNGLHDMGGALRSLATDNKGIDSVRNSLNRARAAFVAFGNDVRTGPIGSGLASIRDGFARIGESARTGLRPAGSALSSLVTSAQNAASKMGAPIVRAFDGMTRAAVRVRDAVSVGATQFFPGLPAAASRARTGLVNMATGAATAARAVGTTAATGLRSAVGGLSAAMGGGWGIALAAGAIAIGTFAQASADSNQRIKDFQSTLTATGGSTFRTYQLGAERAAETTGLLGMGWTTFGDTFYDAARMVGLESRTITEAFAGNEEAIQRARGAIQAFRDEPGIVSPAKTNALVELSDELDRVESEAKIARQNMVDMGEALGTTGERAMYLTSAWDEFGTSVRSGVVSGEQMIGMMDQLAGGTLSAQDAAYNYQSSLKAGKDALKEWAAAHGDSMSSINKHFADGNKTLDMTKQSHRDLYAILRQQVEPAFASVADAFNQFGGGAEGVQAARDTMSSIRDDWFKNLTDVQGMTDDAANAMLDSLNIKPDAVEMLLEKSAAEQSLEEISNSLKLLTGEAQVATVTVEREGFDPLKSDAQNAKEQLNALTSPIYRTMLEAEDRLSPVLDDVSSAASQLAIKDWIVMIAAQDDASGTVNAVRQALEGGFNNQSYEAVLTVLDNASGVAQSAKDKIMSGFVQGDYEAMMTAVDNAGPEAQKVKEQLEAIFNGDSYQAFLEADGSSASEETRAVADAIGDIDNKTAVVNVTNTGADSLERQLARIDSFQDKTVTVTVTNTGADSLNRMRDRIDGLTDKTVTVTVTNSGAESLNRMQSRLDNLQSKSVHVTVTNSGADSLVRLKARIDGIQSKAAKVTVTNSGADSLVRLKSRIDAIKSKSAKVTVTNSGQDSLVRLKQKIDAIKSKSAKVTVTNSGSDSLVRLKQRIDAIKSKSAHVGVTASGHGALASLRSAINSVRGKTVYVNVHTRKTGSAFANGGITAGGVQYFADGGFSQLGKILDRRVRFAWENHTAQIAHAGANRLWAEPETGGEAYIPMSAAKRTRSEDILGEVANRFGGVYVNSRGESSRGSAAVASEGDRYEINISTIDRDYASQVSEDVQFAIKHLRRGGGR